MSHISFRSSLILLHGIKREERAYSFTSDFESDIPSLNSKKERDAGKEKQRKIRTYRSYNT